MTLFEFCAESASDAAHAAQVGAGRIELCADLSVGGVTPDDATLRATLDAVDVPVFCMIRPRGGSFVLDSGDIALCDDQLQRAHALGAHGFVVGALDSNGRPNLQATARWVELAGGRPVTFHRAFDECHDPHAELAVLAELGVRRILTSGGAPSAWGGRARIRSYVELAPPTLGILAGGGVRADHAQALIAATGVAEVHGSVPLNVEDPA